MSKAGEVTRIARLAGISDPGIGVGSSVPRALFEGVCARFGLSASGSMPELAERIIEAAGMPYATRYFDSTETPSGGGSTVTEEGLQQVAAAVELLARRERL